MNEDRASVGVVTVTYNSGAHLGRLLASVPGASRRRVSVVVADNDSDDAEHVRRVTTEHGARFVATGANRGYGSAVNAAVERHLTDVAWILVVNPDVVLGPGSLDVLLDAAEGSPDVGSVGPAVRELDGSLYPSARRVPSLRTGLGHALFANLWPDNPWTRSYHLDREERRRDVGWLSGACVLVEGRAFRELHGFDEGYFMYFEDVDLGYRLARSGRRNIYVPSAEVTHVGAHSTTASSAAMRREHHRSAYRFLSAKYDSWYLLPVRVLLRAALAVRARATRTR